MFRIFYQRSKCIGCNACVEANKYRWRLSRKDGKCHLIGGKEKNGIYSVIVCIDEYDSILIATKNCPAKIIKIDRLY